MKPRLATALVLLVLVTTLGASADPYEIAITYETDGDDCITSINEIDPEEIVREDHLEWFGGDSATGPTIRWDVDPDIADYEWRLSHKTDNIYATELGHFDDTDPFTDTWEREAMRGADQLQTKEYSWHYMVRVRWTGAAGACGEVEPLDPQIVFNGGSGAEIDLNLLATIFAGLALVLLIGWYLRRGKRRAT